MTPTPPDRAALRRRVLASVHGGREFSRLACEIQTYQAQLCLPLRRFWAGRRPNTWRAIPPVPTTLFRDARLATFPPESDAAEFHTSGSSNAGHGRHFLREPELYHATVLPPFLYYTLPEGHFPGRFHVLAAPSLSSHSSLEVMWTLLSQRVQAKDWCFHHREGAPDLASCVQSMVYDSASGQASFVLGTARALWELADSLGQREKGPLSLAPGSRVFETGGFKREERHRSLELLRKRLLDALGLPPWAMVSEYGMTELSSQAYSGELRAHLLGEPPPEPGTLFCANSLRVQTREELLCMTDVANLDSVVSIATGDAGTSAADGRSFTLRGRALGAGLRGCSLRTEAFLAQSTASVSRREHGHRLDPKSLDCPRILADLEQEGQKWRQRTLAQRASCLEKVAQALMIRFTPHPQAASFSEHPRATKKFLLDTLKPLRAEALEEAVRQAQLEAPKGQMPASVLQIAAGTVFTAWLHPAFLTLAAGASHLLKPASSDDLGLAQDFAQLLRAHTGLTLFEVQSWQGGAHPQENALLAHAPAVIAQGGEETMAALRAKLPAHTPRLLYGHRFSLALLHVDDAPSGPQGRGLARDVLSYGGLGCLSPRILILVGGTRQRVQSWVELFARSTWPPALKRYPALSPPLPGETFECRGFAARAAALGRLYSSPVHPIGLGEPGDLGRAPPGPCLAVWSVTREEFQGGLPVLCQDSRLQGLALSPAARAYLGGPPPGSPAWIAPPGQLQCPPVSWPHDGSPPLSPLFAST